MKLLVVDEDALHFVAFIGNRGNSDYRTFLQSATVDKRRRLIIGNPYRHMVGRQDTHAEIYIFRHSEGHLNLHFGINGCLNPVFCRKRNIATVDGDAVKHVSVGSFAGYHQCFSTFHLFAREHSGAIDGHCNRSTN